MRKKGLTPQGDERKQDESIRFGTQAEIEEKAVNEAKRHWLIGGDHKKWQDFGVENILRAVVEGEKHGGSDVCSMDMDECEQDESSTKEEE